MAFTLTGLEGKVAVVTGAGRMRGIGRHIARELARAGCDVVPVGSGRPPESLPDEERAAGWRDIESVAEEVREHGRRAVPLVADVSDPASVDALLERVVAELGGVDIVVNNAAAPRGEDRVPATEIPVDVWRRVVDINLNGAFYVCRAFGRRMIEQGRGGSIVNISTMGAKWYPKNTSAYVASKAGLLALTAVMAQEVGPHKIRVNAVLPGAIETSRMDSMIASGEWQEMLDRMVPLGRASTGEDIGWMTAFLCSDQGAWITGQAYNVDGGQVVWR